MHAGAMHATAEATARYAAGHPEFRERGFYRTVRGLEVSSLGIGTYLGGVDDATDRGYTEALIAAGEGGINVFDCAINYRHQRSERSIGAALKQLDREQIVVCTKAGFLTPGAVPDSLTAADVVGKMHSMAPDFLEDQVARSRANLGVDTIDVFYLHNPETQLGFRTREQFDSEIRRAFARLEDLVRRGFIRWYGAATWDGFRKKDQLDLPRLAAIAVEEGGADHHFRFIQLPFNLGMVEAFVDPRPRNLVRPLADARGSEPYPSRDRKEAIVAAPGPGGPDNLLEAAAALDITVIASATLMQTRVMANMPDAARDLLPGLTTDAQRAIQFTRSTPGIAVALVGMSRREHVLENLGVARVPPASREEYLRLYQ